MLLHGRRDTNSNKKEKARLIFLGESLKVKPPIEPSMTVLETIELIAGQLREAALDSSGWETALNSINAFVGGAGAVILSVEERLKHAPHSNDLLELMDDYFRNGWYANDRREGCVPILRKKGIALDHEFLEIDELDAYYADFLSRHGRKWFAGLGANLDGDLWCLALQRSADQGAFLASDMPRLAAVQMRLEEAASLSRTVGRSWLDGAINSLDGEGGAIILDHRGRILDMNRTARLIVGGPCDTQSSKAFESVLLSALAAAERDVGRATRILIEFGETAYSIEVIPLHHKANLVFSRASSLVRIHQLPCNLEGSLRSRYQLTKSEARVAMALASGMSTSAIAETFKVSPHTVRAQLKAAYAKTETGSQAKLVTFIGQLGRPRPI